MDMVYAQKPEKFQVEVRGKVSYSPHWQIEKFHIFKLTNVLEFIYTYNSTPIKILSEDIYGRNC